MDTPNNFEFDFIIKTVDPGDEIERTYSVKWMGGIEFKFIANSILDVNSARTVKIVDGDVYIKMTNGDWKFDDDGDAESFKKQLINGWTTMSLEREMRALNGEDKEIKSTEN